MSSDFASELCFLTLQHVNITLEHSRYSNTLSCHAQQVFQHCMLERIFGKQEFQHFSAGIPTLKTLEYLLRSVGIPAESTLKTLEYLLCSNMCDFF